MERAAPSAGEMSATVAVSAMSSELPDPSAPLQIVHATFVSPVTAGAIEVDVEVLGRGRSMSHGRAELRTRRGARPPHDDVLGLALPVTGMPAWTWRGGRRPDGSDHRLLVGDATQVCFFAFLDAADR